MPKERLSDIELLLEYKLQWVVEDKFKFLKQPMILGPIWLQKKERINGLIFVLLLAVLVAMYSCYRISESLDGEGIEVKNLPDSLSSNKKGSKVGRRIVLTDGTIIEKPTYKTLIGTISSIKTIKKFDDNHKLTKKFLYGTKLKLLQLIEYIGFSVDIYLQPFSPRMDIWNYAKTKPF